MNNSERLLFDLCTQDQLFCTMYYPLNYMHKKYHSPSPTTVWMTSLGIIHDILESSRPDLKADILLEEADMSIIATIFFMLFAQNMDNLVEHKTLKDKLCEMLNQCELWEDFYEQVRCSEEHEEQNGRYVTTTDYKSRKTPLYEENQAGVEVVKEVVNMTIATNDLKFGSSLAHLLRRIDDQHNGIYHNEILRLEGFVDKSTQRAAINIYGDNVQTKIVEHEVSNVAAGAVGINIDKE